MELNAIIDGNLLGDASIRSDKIKYFTFQLVSKDIGFLEWHRRMFKSYNIRCWISKNNPSMYALGFYINSCPYQELLQLREKWYTKINGKTQKLVPRDLELTPTTLLFWYLGDGCLVRRKNDKTRVPFIVLATNCFIEEDIYFLISKLKELNLNFYPVKYKSGFTGKPCGYCLFSNTQDGTPFRFFNYIGLRCQKAIENCTSGAKGRYREKKFFRDKWPREEDWIKILSNQPEISSIIKQKKDAMNISTADMAKLIGISPRHARHIVKGDRNLGIGNFRKALKALNMDTSYLLKELNKRREG